MMKEWLEETGFEPPEVAVVSVCLAVFRGIDWESPLWKTAGKDMYDRFESRIRSAAREHTLARFASKLARKCHVSTPYMDQGLLQSLTCIADHHQERGLDFARSQSGLAVAAMRAFRDEKKANQQALLDDKKQKKEVSK